MSEAAHSGGSVASAQSNNDPFNNEDRIRQVLESLPAAVYTTDAEGFLTFHNKAAAEMAGREPILGSSRWCITRRLYRPDGALLPADEYPIAIALRENRALRGVEILAERLDGTRICLLAYPGPIQDASGRPIGAVNLLVDISERKAAETALRESLRELNHRMMNNMQMLQSLLGAAEREASSREAREILADAARRVGAMAASQRAVSAGLMEYEARSFLEALSRSASQSFGRQADIQIETASGVLSNDMVLPLALIVNELITNAVKHGKGERSYVSIKLGLADRGKDWLLSVEDDGPGFVLENPRRRASGLGLVIGLAGQLGGRLDVATTTGARCAVIFRPVRSANP
jgi:PAS domain S-box-containing protein